MATLWVTEYSWPAGNVPVPKEPAIGTQVVSFTTSVQSAAFADGTSMVRVIADAACHLLFGADPTATTDHQRLAADTAELRQVKPGDKVAAAIVAA